VQLSRFLMMIWLRDDVYRIARGGPEGWPYQEIETSCVYDCPKSPVNSIYGQESPRLMEACFLWVGERHGAVYLRLTYGNKFSVHYDFESQYKLDCNPTNCSRNYYLSAPLAPGEEVLYIRSSSPYSNTFVFFIITTTNSTGFKLYVMASELWKQPVVNLVLRSSLAPPSHVQAYHQYLYLAGQNMTGGTYVELYQLNLYGSSLPSTIQQKLSTTRPSTNPTRPDEYRNCTVIADPGFFCIATNKASEGEVECPTDAEACSLEQWDPRCTASAYKFCYTWNDQPNCCSKCPYDKGC